MRFLVTGATGFLGSHLTRALIQDGHEVMVLARQGSDMWRLADVLSRVSVVTGDLRQLGDIKPVLLGAGINGVAHLAWDGVGNDARDSVSQVANVPATVELVSLAAEAGAHVFVGTGSQAEYGPYPRAISESDETHPTTLYGLAKLSAGAMSGHVARELGLRFAWLRVFSTYGPGDADIWLIPRLISSLDRGERMPLTACEQRWGFLHATDAADAFRRVLMSSAAHGVFNVGHPDAPTLRSTVELLRGIMMRSCDLGFGEVPYRSDQVMVLQAEVARLRELGWEPLKSLEQGLKETVDWYRTRPDRSSRR